MVGESVAMRALRGQISIVAPSDGRVLIMGESGTGKELVARAIHLASSRASHPFIEVNCAAIPEELIESELFGHARGAFTGATSPKRGKFEAADGGTLFLDEVGDMSLRAQSKVLRVLEENCFEPLGAARTVRVDVRVIAATNKRLEAEIEQGSFRADLFYRLNVIPFQVPPLRERLEDVPLLVEHFNGRFSAMNSKEPKRFSPEAMRRLCEHTYPGNVRELRNTIERVCIMHQAETVEADDLPPLGSFGIEHAPEPSFGFPSFREASESYQREFIRRKLAESDGNVTRAAELMGVDRSHLYRRLRQLGIKQK
jgi:two-component system nitrogen regulation response regulator NtrX